MKRSFPGRAAVLFVLALLSLATLPATAAASSPEAWYAERLTKLGFRVYPSPITLPDFQAEPLAGGQFKLSQLRGKVVLLNFWATWCPPCRAEMPSIEALHKKMAGKDFAIMGVSTGEERGTVEKFIAQAKYSFPIYLDRDGRLGSSFNARSIPTTYLIDKQGRAIASVVGSRMYDGPEVVSLFEELARR